MKIINKPNTKFISNVRFTLFLFARKSKGNPDGYMLFLVVSLLITLSGLLVAYAILAKVHTLSAKGSATGNSGFYGAEGALNVRVEELRNIFLSERNPVGTSPTSLNGCLQQTNLGSGDYRCKVMSFAAPDDTTAKILAYSYVVPVNNGQPVEGTVPSGDTFGGLSMLEILYDISAIAAKDNNNPDDVIATTQMRVKSRQIPMFQFAAFYLNDLEILPGATMTLAGPVHTNGRLFLGGGPLTITGQVTIGGTANPPLSDNKLSLFNSRKNSSATFAEGLVRIANGAGTAINLLSGGTGGTTATTAAMTPANITTTWGSRVQLGVNALSIPAISELGAGGPYQQQADVRFVYIPANTIPFTVTSIKRNPNGSIISETALTNAQLASLRQPVLVTGALAGVTGTYNVCTPGATPNNASGSGTALTTTQMDGLPNALRSAILSRTIPVPFSVMDSNLNDTNLTGVRDAIAASLTLTTEQTTRLGTFTPNQVAALANGCFVGAPIQDPSTGVSFFNNRDNRNISLLQINLESLTIWNSQGFYQDGTTLTSANELLFTRAAADSDAPADSFQRLGLAGSDVSSNGLVFHATVTAADATPANPVTSTNSSPYGIALIKGRQLPGLAETSNNSDPTGLTFVSDQAVYLQGDYNSLNWQPASILADSLSILSNRCLNTNDDRIVKATGMGCGGNATETTVNTAFLAGTDITNGSNYNGGLENYPRLHENWSGINLNYLGSFVSTGTPLRVRTNWPGTGGNHYNAPTRNWGYETRFNQIKNLPPLSPRFVFLKQEDFSRNFD